MTIPTKIIEIHSEGIGTPNYYKTDTGVFTTQQMADFFNLTTKAFIRFIRIHGHEHRNACKVRSRKAEKKQPTLRIIEELPRKKNRRSFLTNQGVMSPTRICALTGMPIGTFYWRTQTEDMTNPDFFAPGRRWRSNAEEKVKYLSKEQKKREQEKISKIAQQISMSGNSGIAAIDPIQVKVSRPVIREVEKKKRPKQTLEERDADYRKALRQAVYAGNTMALAPGGGVSLRGRGE